MYFLFYMLALVAMLLNAPKGIFDPASSSFLLIIGVIGIWRYSWGLVHLVRSITYRSMVFPGWRRAARESFADFDQSPEKKPEVFIVITAFRIPVTTLRQVFAAAFDEAVNYGGRVTIVASIVEMGDQRFIKQLYQRLHLPGQVQLMFTRVAGTGKRDGLATALTAVGREVPRRGSVVIVMDADALLPTNLLNDTVSLMRRFPAIGGLTTDEDAIVEGGGRIMTDWHRLRFAQRHILMSSLAWSRRLLTMTGRLSVYRAEIATNASFIKRIREDSIDYWRFGTVPLITGEDKSTWSWLLERNLDMLYVPDVRVWTIEHPPSKNFLVAATRLMQRWSGNMLRVGGRAIRQGPNGPGLFTWWCLLDQRLSMWTPLIGPIAAICLSLTTSPWFLYIYVLWVMLTRLVQTLFLLSARDTISGTYPWLIYFNQLYGALVKIFIYFRPNRQRWTRQSAGHSPAAAGWWTEWWSWYFNITAVLALFAVIALLTGLISWPDRLDISAIL